MFSQFALAAFAAISLPAAEQPGLAVVTDEELSTRVGLTETEDHVRFEFAGPDSVAPTIAIDINRNGTVDPNVDFQVSSEKSGSPCLQLLLDDRRSSICKPAGNRASASRSRGPEATTTLVTFPKREISGDGFGFGFSIKLCSLTEHYCTSPAGGDYRFGGKLSLVADGPRFNRDIKSDIRQPLLTALRRYEGCVNKAIGALAPLDRSRAAAVRALPTTCAADRSAALDEGVKALVASGVDRHEATELMRSSLDGYDETIGQMAQMLEKGG